MRITVPGCHSLLQFVFVKSKNAITWTELDMKGDIFVTLQ